MSASPHNVCCSRLAIHSGVSPGEAWIVGAFARAAGVNHTPLPLRRDTLMSLTHRHIVTLSICPNLNPLILQVRATKR